MLLALRLLWLMLLAAGAHFQNGLAYPPLLLSALIGWLGWRPWWTLPLIVIPAFVAAQIYVDATGTGKLPGAMSNVVFQCGVFALLSLAGFVLGWALRRR